MADFITRAMLFLTGFTMPLSYLTLFSIGRLGVTPNKFTTAGLLFIAIVLGVVERRRMPRNPKGWWVIGFASSMLMGTMIILLRGASANQIAIVASVLAAVVIFYFLLVYVVRSMEDLDALLVGLVGGISLSSLSVLMRWGPIQVGRTGGFSGDPNNFAFVTAVTLPIVGYYYATTRSRVAKFLCVGVAVLSLTAISASLSRTGVVVLGAMAVMWMARFRRFDILRFAIPVGIVLVAAVFLTSPEWRERMGTLTDTRRAAADGPIQQRLLLNTLAVQAFVENPVVGVGYNAFPSWAGARTNRAAIHNAYLHVMAELGLVGIISFLGLIAASYVEYSRCTRLCRSLRARGDPLLEKLFLLSVLLQISLVGALVGNLFLNSMRYRISWLLYAGSTIVLLLARQRARQLGSEGPASVEATAEFRPAHMMDTGPKVPVQV